MKSLALLLFVAALLPAQTYTLGPDSQPLDGAPKGTVTKHVLPPGKLYPGTPHNYSLYVPAQYDPAKPTAFMIFLDGSGMLGNGVRVPVVFDNLIASHDLPPMIGIFIDPGVLPTLSDNAQNRYERIFEYDSLSDRFSSFLIDELIPEIAKSYNLSKDPNDRALSGVSTGAVGAFMAAWNRPDQFHRVLSFIGTYVAMKGADSLPALIRKNEPKPIRIFLQDGSNDHIVPTEPYGTNFSGSWPINNQVMYQALEYSGYDAKLVLGTEGHNMKQGGAIMPEALRWLWRGYPAPIVVHEPEAMHTPDWDPRGKVYATVYADKPWEKIEGSYTSAVSPTADRDGNVYFADPATHSIYKSNPDGKVTPFKQVTGSISELAYGADNRLYVAEPSLRRIVSYSASAGDERIVARDVSAHSLTLTAKGMVYFTDQEHKTIGLVDASGRTRTVYSGGDLAVPSGIALSPDQAMLIVSDAQSRFSWSFQIASDGSLLNGEPFFRLEMPESGWLSNVGGVAEDATGQQYFATPVGIQVCEASGRMIEILNAPEPGTAVTGIAFAGTSPAAWIYATEGNSLYRRPVKITPAYPWAPTKPPKPLL
jgi:sugar lactone lactonase YvrE/predicted esterase